MNKKTTRAVSESFDAPLLDWHCLDKGKYQDEGEAVAGLLAAQPPNPQRHVLRP